MLSTLLMILTGKHLWNCE